MARFVVTGRSAAPGEEELMLVDVPLPWQPVKVWAR